MDGMQDTPTPVVNALDAVTDAAGCIAQAQSTLVHVLKMTARGAQEHATLADERNALVVELADYKRECNLYDAKVQELAAKLADAEANAEVANAESEGLRFRIKQTRELAIRDAMAFFDKEGMPGASTMLRVRFDIDAVPTTPASVDTLGTLDEK